MSVRIIVGDARTALRELAARSVHLCVTSPPYWNLRDYKTEGQIGLEATPEAYVSSLVAVFREARRVLHDTGSLWVNLGDSYSGGGGYYPEAPSNLAGSLASRSAGKGGARTANANRNGSGLPAGSLLGIPWRVAYALQADGWLLRSAITCVKRNPMPESVSGVRWEGCRIKVAPTRRALPGSHHAEARAGVSNGHGARDGADFDSRGEYRDCPGCEKCRDTGGLVLRWGSGRPTSATEMIFMFAKTSRYFFDSDAVRLPYSAATIAQLGAEYTGGNLKDYDGNGVQAPGDVKRRTIESLQRNGGANCRNWMFWPTAEAANSEYVETEKWVALAPGDEPCDTDRRESSGCPVHGSSDHSDPTVVCGERRAVLQSAHNPDTSGCPDEKQRDGREPIARNRASGFQERSMGLPGLECEDAAIEHSSETRRKARALATRSLDTVCEETASGIADTSALPSSAEPRPGTGVSSNVEDALGDNPSNQKRGCTAGMSPGSETFEASESPSCSCKFYRKLIVKTGHFASFPPGIPAFCIKAGTSEKGVCPACGAPWARVLTREQVAERDDEGRTHSTTAQRNGRTPPPERGWETTRQTTDWRPTCTCPPAAPIPATILDPFGGSGTSALAADRLGRNAILVEISDEYAAMSRRRFTRDAGLFAELAP